jgi:serine/threonine protein kinase
VKLFGWFESDNYIYIAMEYVGPGNLRDYLEVERLGNERRKEKGEGHYLAAARRPDHHLPGRFRTSGLVA